METKVAGAFGDHFHASFDISTTIALAGGGWFGANGTRRLGPLPLGKLLQAERRGGDGALRFDFALMADLDGGPAQFFPAHSPAPGRGQTAL